MPQSEPIDPLYELLERANPNPDRIGCLADYEILEFAQGKQRVTDPRFAHLTACFQCYRKFRESRSEVRQTVFHKRLVVVAAIAASLVIGALLIWQLRTTSPGTEVTKKSVTTTPAAQAKLALIDLRPFAVTRSESPKAANEPIVLGRDRFAATIYLPVGSEPGPYEIQVLTENLVSLRSATTIATLKDGITSVTAELDLQSLLVGKYQLALRLSGQDWRFYPLAIK